MDETTQPGTAGQLEVMGRPLGQLHDYPVPVRWEVSRRHPYYLVFWKDALRYRRNPEEQQPAQMLLNYAASLILGSIGVTGETVSPATRFEDLIGGDNNPAFLSGSVQPMTFRALISMLINGLPPAECEVVAAVLSNAGSATYEVSGDDANSSFQKRLAQGDLIRLASTSLDSYPMIPLFYIHLGASQRSIAADMEDQVRRWKARRGLGSSNVHTAKLDRYLEVWDLREGWTGGAYDRSRELTFAEVGRRLKIKKISTVANRYRSAFEMITGHQFMPELWWRLFGPLKLSRMLGDPAAILSAPIRRHLRSPVRRPVPDSRVSPETDRPHSVGMAEGGSAICDDIELRDLLLDLERLIGLDLTDDEIARRLELKDPDVVAVVRGRIDEFRSI